MKKIKITSIIIFIISLLGVLNSLFRFLQNRSLWFDESMISVNIINKNFFELFKPLEYNQIAPILFLQLEKLFSLISNSEYSLRILPLLSFWISIYLFLKIVNIVFKNKYTVIFSLSIFVFNNILLYYSSEVKQYMLDVLVLILVYFLLLKTYNCKKNQYYILCIVGCVSIFISNITPVVLFTIGIYLLINSRIKGKEAYILYLILFSSWLISFSFYYSYFIHENPASTFMVKWWSLNNSFMPLNPFSLEMYKFIWIKGILIFSSLFPASKIHTFICFLLFIIGNFILLFQKKIGLLVLFLTPICLHLILSSCRLYPFELRLILYIFPTFILPISFGFDYLVRLSFIDLRIKDFRILAILIPLYFIILSKQNGFPLEGEEIKNSLIYLNQNIEKENAVYIYYGAIPAFRYYNDIKFTNISIPIILGNNYRDNNLNYIKELQLLKGQNWILFSHTYKDEKSFILSTLDSLGFKKKQTFNTINSSVYLYDFTK
jgi:hypothetical protein